MRTLCVQNAPKNANVSFLFPQHQPLTGFSIESVRIFWRGEASLSHLESLRSTPETTGLFRHARCCNAHLPLPRGPENAATKAARAGLICRDLRALDVSQPERHIDTNMSN